MYKAAFICIAVFTGSMLGGCQSAQTVLQGVSPYVQAGNTAGAIVAGIVAPAIAIPAGAVAGALNGAWQSTTATTK